MQEVEVSNGCGDVTHGEGPLWFNLTLPPNFPPLSQLQFSEQLFMQVNFSHIPKFPNHETDSTIHNVDISNTLHTPSKWTSGRSIQLAIDREAVPLEVMEGIKRRNERFRTQIKLVFNEISSSEWSPLCESPIFQPCLSSK